MYQTECLQTESLQKKDKKFVAENLGNVEELDFMGDLVGIILLSWLQQTEVVELH